MSDYRRCGVTVEPGQYPASGRMFYYQQWVPHIDSLSGGSSLLQAMIIGCEQNDGRIMFEIAHLVTLVVRGPAFESIWSPVFQVEPLFQAVKFHTGYKNAGNR